MAKRSCEALQYEYCELATMANIVNLAAYTEYEILLPIYSIVLHDIPRESLQALHWHLGGLRAE